jgi:hypothetical protein
MKHLAISILVVLLFISCSTAHRSSKSEDTSKSVKSIEMTDKLSAFPVEINGKKTPEKIGNVKTIHRFEVEKIGKVNLSVEFLSGALISDTGLDSVVYLLLDGEKIDIFRISDRKFEVPENLWVSIVNSSKIEYLLPAGKDEFNLRPNQTQTKNMKFFFERAIRNRDLNLAPVQEGLKKW